MKKIFLGLLSGILLAGAFCHAADLTIAEKNVGSNYQIAVPESTGNKAMDRFLLTAAEALRNSIRQATGVSLPVVKENARTPAKPAIYIGDTQALRKAGFTTDGLKKWEHRIDVKGKDIFLYGNDVKSNPKGRWPND